jgi:uncharacterized membrane protein YgaE (UPF0421/DUF939 family)
MFSFVAHPTGYQKLMPQLCIHLQRNNVLTFRRNDNKILRNEEYKKERRHTLNERNKSRSRT